MQALIAGNDILLLPADVPKAVKRIRQALDKGELPLSLVDERCRKVLAYKYKAGLSQEKAIKTENLYTDLNSSKARALNRTLYEASVTLVRNENNILPLERLDTLQIAYVSLGASLESDHFGSTLGLYGRIDQYALSSADKKKNVNDLLEVLEAYNLIIVGIRNTNIYSFKNYGIPEENWSFLRELTKNKKVILDLFASPYALSALGSAELPEGIIVSYQDNELTEEVGAQLIFGGIGAQGRLPVGVAGLYESGHGIDTRPFRFHFVDAASLGINDNYIEKADSIALSGIQLKAYPGCQVIAAKDGKIFYNKCFGYHTYDNKQILKQDDIYDLASLTKIAATTLAVMDMYAKGSIDIDQRLSKYLPYLINTNKKDIIIRELLAPQSRFRAWIPYFRYTVEGKIMDPDIYSKDLSEEYPIRVADGMYINKDYYHAVLDSIRFSSLRENNQYRYSDLGFYLIKEALENINNVPFEDQLEENYYSLLGLPTMGFLPLHRFEPSRIVPTEDDKVFRMQLLQGDVHDQGAAMLGGVSGHAGLFSNAFDMAVIMQLYLDGGSYGGHQYIKEEVLDEFTETQFPLNGNRRGVGFDKPMLEYDEEGPTCKSVSHSSFGHSGFTGTYAWADPENGLVYVFLSNRVCPDASNAKIMEYDIRTNLHQVFYDALKNAEVE